jgi:Zn-dependent M28 family amino/carboxypeptidase
LLIRERLRQAGWPVREQRFTVTRPQGGEVEMVNLVASRRGAQPGRIWLGAHYDTKDLSGMRFVGANDGASGVAVLLELARVLGTDERPFTIELLFFDGEESFGPSITPSDGLYGSRAFAEAAAARGELGEVHALLLVDMVGDRDLNLALDRNSAAWLRLILQEEAERVSPGLVDGRQVLTLVDDHVPFLEAGLGNVLAIIDFQFGGRRTPGRLWHTAADDLEAVSAESLNRVGRLVVQILTRVERRLLKARP